MKRKWERCIAGSYFDRDHMEERKKSTELLNFTCSFDEEGLCKYRTKTEDPDVYDLMCCCNSCQYSEGHFHADKDLVSEEQSSYLHLLFDEETGFWRKGEGCVIPRKWRSAVCVTFNCENRGGGSGDKLTSVFCDLLMNYCRTTVKQVFEEEKK